jgi:hypothetical protein
MENKRKPTWTHKEVTNYIKNYRSMLTRTNRDPFEIQYFGDPGEILQSLELYNRGGFKPTWMRRVNDKVLVHMDIESLSDPKNRPYEVKATLHKVDNTLFATSHEDMEHVCKDSQFSGGYRHRGGVVSPDHHEITARRAMENYLPKWCGRFDIRPAVEIKPIYKKIAERHEKELLRILNKEATTLKSIGLRERIYIYLTENDIELYGIGD